jgi:hypothetical protein
MFAYDPCVYDEASRCLGKDSHATRDWQGYARNGWHPIIHHTGRRVKSYHYDTHPITLPTSSLVSADFIEVKDTPTISMMGP